MGFPSPHHTTSHIMRFFVAVSALVASAVAGPAVLSHTVNGVPIAGYAGAYAPAVAAPYVAPYAAPAYTGSQFHAQDEFGNLNYGYANLNSAKQEIGNTYGGVQGGYSYVDAAGVLQQVQSSLTELGSVSLTLVFPLPPPSTPSLWLLPPSTLSLLLPPPSTPSPSLPPS